MPRATVLLNLNSEEFEAIVHYTHSPLVPAKLYGPPEDCYPEEPEEWELYELTLTTGEDITCLLGYVLEDLIEQLEESLDETDMEIS